MAAAGAPRRSLPSSLPAGLQLPAGFTDPQVVAPGILAIQAPDYRPPLSDLRRFCNELSAQAPLSAFPLIVLCNDSRFVARSLQNFLWVTFTRSNPAVDIDGGEAFTEDKHWGCHGPLVIDARLKPHHAPPLIEDPEVTRKVDQLAAPGGPLDAGAGAAACPLSCCEQAPSVTSAVRATAASETDRGGNRITLSG
jgi:4-hydroxy-3-polyprenylbenzoate decarboxylase